MLILFVLLILGTVFDAFLPDEREIAYVRIGDGYYQVERRD
jgi:hypothetical protein